MMKINPQSGFIGKSGLIKIPKPGLIPFFNLFLTHSNRCWHYKKDKCKKYSRKFHASIINNRLKPDIKAPLTFWDFFCVDVYKCAQWFFI